MAKNAPGEEEIRVTRIPTQNVQLQIAAGTQQIETRRDFVFYQMTLVLVIIIVVAVVVA